MNIALTIAGSDSGGGAGIQADLKTFEAHGVFGASVITAITAQNTKGVQGIWPVPVEMVDQQLQSVLADIKIRSVKTGMLHNAETIKTVARHLRQFDFPLVVDPVMIATSGDSLLEESAVESLKEELLPLAKVITPNLAEAEALSGIMIRSREDMEFAARILKEFFPSAWILIKGGHFKDDNMATDLLFSREYYWLETRRIRTKHTHGTGCTFSAAIAANLARRSGVFSAVKASKSYIYGAIKHAWKSVGKERGSLRHNWQAEEAGKSGKVDID